MESAPTPTMRSLAIEKYCKPGEYEILDLPLPKIAAPDQILIKVHAASINPVDVKIASGLAKMVWALPYVLPFTPPPISLPAEPEIVLRSVQIPLQDRLRPLRSCCGRWR